MNVRILVGAEHAYACIDAPEYTMDVRLEPERAAEQSLRESAADLRKQALVLQQRASRMEEAALILDAGEAIPFPAAGGWRTAEPNQTCQAATATLAASAQTLR